MTETTDEEDQMTVVGGMGKEEVAPSQKIFALIVEKQVIGKQILFIKSNNRSNECREPRKARDVYFKDEVKCFKCNEKGHIQRDCKAR